MNQHIADLSARVLAPMAGERRWNGQTITEPGVWSGIRLAEYHERNDLFDGPSISKSALKWLLPTHGGSPKAFWGRWKFNPDHIEPKTTDALDFGKAVHCLLLGDEVFADSFALRPEQWTDWRTKAAQEWRADMQKAGKTIITIDQFDRIRRMSADAAGHPLVKAGILNGRVERTMCAKDPDTGIWVKARPDVVPTDALFSDLKTASSFDEDFLERQAFDACYYLQAALLRFVCRHLGVPFDTFALVYLLNDDIPDTAVVEISEHEIDRGERELRWCLNTIRKCIDAGEWPGARPFAGGERHLQFKPWVKERIDSFLEMEEAA